MTVRAEVGPYPFTEDDLAPDRLLSGVEHTLADFYAWRDANPQAVAEHLDAHTQALESAISEYGLGARLYRQVIPQEKRAFRNRKTEEEIGFFAIYNMAEIPDAHVMAEFRNTQLAKILTNEKAFAHQDGTNGLLSAIDANLPVLRGAEEVSWLEQQLQHLGRILPESVMRDGGFGKAALLMASVLIIGTYDTLHEPELVQRAHLRRIIPAAYAYGVTYPIIDDTLEDSDYVSDSDRDRYHKTILRGLRTGKPLSPTALPDHPLAEELEQAYNILLKSFPFDTNRHLYYAGESMFLAQERDSSRTAEDIALGGLKSMYPDIFVKAAMTRVVANIIGQRRLDSTFYQRAINATFLNQFRDDLFDRRADQAAARLTPFTYERQPSDTTNPLYDLFAYSAYVVSVVFENDPDAYRALTNHNAAKLAVYLHADPEFCEAALQDPQITPGLARFLTLAQSLSKGMVQSPYLLPRDVRHQRDAIRLFKGRTQTDIDPRTFVSDRLKAINDVIAVYHANKNGPLDTITQYMLETGGKRLRPALTLMLAEGLGIKPHTIAPLLVAIEQYHTASLIFDDLPAQDNASQRRGRPAAHIAFNEADAQLAGIAMISQGFGHLEALAQYYPADKVVEVIRYFGEIMGPEGLCRGQEMDLRLSRSENSATEEEILRMYAGKTSTLIEAALVPLMTLIDRPAHEVALLTNYAYHAGIAFQIRDDILDVEGNPSLLGKPTGNDVHKVNLVRNTGLAHAEQRMHQHLANALASCHKLPFNTALLQGIAEHFVYRKK